MTEEPTRRRALLDPILTDKEELSGNVKVRGILSCSGHEIVDFRNLKGEKRAKSKRTTLDFRRVEFGLFKNLLGRVASNKTLEERWAQES